MSNEKEAFEADAAAYGFDLTRRECAAPEPWSEYADDATGHRWAGWSAALAWAATQQAPVAWSVKTADDLLIFQEERHAMHYSEKWGYSVVPLYAHPAHDECAVPEWRPIETAPVEPFDKERWFMSHSPALLLYIGRWVIGRYNYTKLGKGKWEADGRVVNPTHWMPLPAAPKPQGGA